MTIPDSASPPRRFAFHGPIRIWDATERRLSLGGRDLWLAPGISANELEVGTQIVAKGYEGLPGDHWIVDAVTITGIVNPWRPRPSLRRPQRRL